MSGSEPKSKLSINPTAWQFVVTVGTLVALGYAGVSFIVGHEFDKRLKLFHEVVAPRVYENIEQEVDDHAELPAHGGVIERIHAIENEAGVAKTERANIQTTVDSNARKLDTLIEDRRVNRGVP